eukprot:11384049-Alexandrium_andersonii.AAC.1
MFDSAGGRSAGQLANGWSRRDVGADPVAQRLPCVQRVSEHVSISTVAAQEQGGFGAPPVGGCAGPWHRPGAG